MAIHFRKLALLFLFAIAATQVHAATCISQELRMRLTARDAGLSYILPNTPGITRTLQKGITRKVLSSKGKSVVVYKNSRGDVVTDPEEIFIYRNAKGKIINNETELERIHEIGLPPAYDRVWISPDPDSHLQAMGYNLNGDQQYRYHPAWDEARAKIKFKRMREFGEALPSIREKIQKDFSHSSPRAQTLATIVKLLDKTFIRIGNEEYAEKNGTFGLTTLLKKDVKLVGDGEIRFRFIGKADVAHDITVADPALAKAIAALKKIPGPGLFQYRDLSGRVHGIDSADVNAYIREISGGDFTAKDFRTWGGTVSAAQVLIQEGKPKDDAMASRAVQEAVDFSCSRLGNTPAICREKYIHPLVLQSYEDESGKADLFFKAVARARAYMSRRNQSSGDQAPATLSEQTVLTLLELADTRKK